MIELNLKAIWNNKFEVNSNQRIVTCNVTQFQSAATLLSEIEILRSTHVRNVTKFYRIFVFKVSPYFVWKWA
jgi:hypothetical protein